MCTCGLLAMSVVVAATGVHGVVAVVLGARGAEDVVLAVACADGL